jgi:ACS family hexuronate transporter-like MFS transporter
LDRTPDIDAAYAPPGPDKTPAAALSPARAWALALTATFTMSVSYVDRQTLAALAPTVTKALQINETSYGWLISAFSIAYLLASPLAGRLIDAVGARRGMLGAVLLWSAVAGLHALVPSFAVLFALRIALGLAEAPSFPGAAQTIHRALPPGERARGLGILFTGSSFGAMVAPKLAAFFNEHWGFRAAFLGSALVGLVWVPIWLALAWTGPGRAALDRRESRGPAFRARDLVRNGGVWRAVVMILACAPLLGLHFNWLSKFLDRRFQVTQAEIGNLLILPPLLFDAGAILFGSLATRAMKQRPDDDRPPHALLIGSTLVAMTGAFLPLCPGPWTAMVVAGISMAGGGGLYSLVTADLLRRVPPAAVSTAGGTLAAAQSLALIVANPVIGKSVEITGGYGLIFLALALLHLPGAAAWLLWRPPPVYRLEPEPTT